MIAVQLVYALFFFFFFFFFFFSYVAFVLPLFVHVFFSIAVFCDCGITYIFTYNLSFLSSLEYHCLSCHLIVFFFFCFFFVCLFVFFVNSTDIWKDSSSGYDYAFCNSVGRNPCCTGTYGNMQHFSLWTVMWWNVHFERNSNQLAHLQCLIWVNFVHMKKSLHPFLYKMRPVKNLISPGGYKTSFMLNSAEHEIFSANKYENANNSWHFHIY